jgi:hypothetical protein
MQSDCNLQCRVCRTVCIVVGLEFYACCSVLSWTFAAWHVQQDEVGKQQLCVEEIDKVLLSDNSVGDRFRPIG